MRSLLLAVRHERTQNGHEVLLVQNDDVIEALSPQGAEHSLRNSVRFWGVDRGGDGVDADASCALTKVAAVDGIAITQQMPWRVSPGCCLDHLSPDPGRRGAGRHIDVDQLTPTMSDEDEHVQGLEGERGYS